MEQLESSETEESVETQVDNEVEEFNQWPPETFEECWSLEYDDQLLKCSTATPSFDEVNGIKGTNDPAFWITEPHDFLWSDSDQSEIDFELCMKPALGQNSDKTCSKCGNKENAKIKYLKIKSGNIAKKIRLNITDMSNNYLDRVKRYENYNKLLNMIQRLLEKGDGTTVIVTPDESELQGMTEEEKEEQRRIWQQELAKIEEEIRTLRQVLQSKIEDSQRLKRKLGISVWKELTNDLSYGVKNVKETQVYQKTESVVKATAESTRSLIGGFTCGFTQKIGQLKNSESFRSLEEKVGSAYENVKSKVSSRSSSMQNFDEALREETISRSNSLVSPTIPEGKVMP